MPSSLPPTEDCADFDREMASLLDSKLPVSASKIDRLTALASRSLQHHRFIVESVEQFLAVCPADYKLAGLYVLHAILTNKKAVPDSEYVACFQERLPYIFPHITHCPGKDWDKVQRVIKMWRKGGLFTTVVLDKIENMPYQAPFSNNNPDADIEPTDARIRALVFAPAVLSMAATANVDCSQLAVALAQLLHQGGIGNSQVAAALSAASQPDQPNHRQASMLHALLIAWQQQREKLTADAAAGFLADFKVEGHQYRQQEQRHQQEPILQQHQSSSQPDARTAMDFDYGESDDDLGTSRARQFGAPQVVPPVA